jgi:uncharacterized protein (DUF2235 family)
MSSPQTIPPPRKHRNIVILLDGTGNQFGMENTNLIKFMSVLMADDEQLVYYSSGVGGSHSPL